MKGTLDQDFKHFVLLRSKVVQFYPIHKATLKGGFFFVFRLALRILKIKKYFEIFKYFYFFMSELMWTQKRSHPTRSSLAGKTDSGMP